MTVKMLILEVKSCVYITKQSGLRSNVVTELANHNSR